MSLLNQFSKELETLVEKTSPSVVGVEHEQGQGTGIVLTQDGYVLTNAHVVRGARALTVRLAGGEPVTAERVGADSRSDLAVLRVHTGKLMPLTLADTRRLRVGQVVVAIGNPFRFERSVSLGVVSAIDRSLPGPQGAMEGLVQTDAAINPGNSGGPLVDTEGAVVGINTAIVPFAQGIGFAVPSHTASWVVALLIARGEIRRPLLGVSAAGIELYGEHAAQAGQNRGVRIHRVAESSPAARAGLKEGDVMLKADGSTLLTVDDLQRVMVLSGKEELDLELFRNGETLRKRAFPSAPPERLKRAG